MTIQQIKNMADWDHALRTRSVHVKIGSLTLRVVMVGRIFVKVMHGNGRVEPIHPSHIDAIIGL